MKYFLSYQEQHLNHFELVFHHIQLADDVLLHLIMPGKQNIFFHPSKLYPSRHFSDVVHSASSNMLPYRTQPAVVCVAQVKSTVND